LQVILVKVTYAPIMGEIAIPRYLQIILDILSFTYDILQTVIDQIVK
jgi:hypothetical protein